MIANRAAAEGMTNVMERLTAGDKKLCDAAAALLIRAHDPAQHRVAAAVRGRSGAIYVGLSLKTTRVDVCAEPSAISNARIGGEHAVDTIVAVGLDRDGAAVVINPCGVCRELVPHFGEDIRVVVSLDGELGVVPARDLLPIPWVRARTYD